MKPRTKLQKRVLELSKTLSPLTAHQHKEVIDKVAPHIAKYNSKKEYVCLDCGHSWIGDKAENVRCPHCNSNLRVNTSRTWNFTCKDYFSIITKRKEFQVIRVFYAETSLRRGRAAIHWIGEAFQKWLSPDGKTTIIGRKRHWLGFYCDNWDWSSDLEIRQEHLAHSIDPHTIIGQPSVIPELKRNGYKGNVHNCCPHHLFEKLLKDNRVETIWKLGRYKLAHYAISNSYTFEKYWSSVKVALRNGYRIEDPSMWFDLLECLKICEKDIRNPKYICPSNLKEAHDEWLRRRRDKINREEREAQRRREMTEEQRYLEDLKRVMQDEDNYRESKSQFFDLMFKDDELTVKPLTSVREFIEEGHLMHHCVFSNRYFLKDNALILHAMVDNVSVATIEFSLENFTVVQCRGVHNQKPALYDRIVKLINDNTSKIIAKTA